MGSKRKWEVPSRHTVWEFDEDAPVGAEAEAILSERGAEEIAAELLAAGAIVGGDPDVGVQVEAVEVAWRGPREVRCPRWNPATGKMRPREQPTHASEVAREVHWTAREIEHFPRRLVLLRRLAQANQGQLSPADHPSRRSRWLTTEVRSQPSSSLCSVWRACSSSSGS